VKPDFFIQKKLDGDVCSKIDPCRGSEPYAVDTKGWGHARGWKGSFRKAAPSSRVRSGGDAVVLWKAREELGSSTTLVISVSSGH